MSAVSRFASDKARVLGQVDLSRKGSVDAAIAPLLRLLNDSQIFYSTSSCAGRLVVFTEEGDQKKRGCQWLLISHDPVQPEQLASILSSQLPDSGYVWLKYEPFILHVMCATLTDAQMMLQTAVSSGFRNSGLSCGKKGRWMVAGEAVRSTHSLEAPLAHDGRVIASAEYCGHLLNISNSKLRENWTRTDRFLQQLQSGLSKLASSSEHKQPLHPPHQRQVDTGRDKSHDGLESGPAQDDGLEPGHCDITTLFSEDPD